MIKVVVFDFDGVILESSQIKTNAFREIFKNEPESKVNALIDYHLENMGISRQKKFEYFYNVIEKKTITPQKLEELSLTFSKIVWDLIIKAPFVKGMPYFLQEFCKEYPLYIATGTPHDEIIKITDIKQITNYFTGIFGTPQTKEEIIEAIIKNNSCKPSEVVFFGDAESDRLTAENTKTNFIARLGHGSEMMKKTKYYINNFENIEEIKQIISLM